MNNLRFSTALHILVLLEKFKGKLITSEFIANSVNVNPVVIRKELLLLKKAKYIGSKKGKDGGCFLLKKSEDIYLGDLYKIINHTFFLGKMNQTNPICPIGKRMNENLENLFQDVELHLTSKLNNLSLKDFSNQFVNESIKK